MQKPDFQLPCHPLTRSALIEELGWRFGKGILGTYPGEHGLAETESLSPDGLIS